MKKIKYLLSLFVVLALMFTCTFAAFAADYTVEVKDENNLAANKWDWATDKVGSGSATFGENGMKIENFNLGSSIYAIYKTNKMNEFKYSMHANLNLTRPSQVGADYNHDYSNLYISFMINADTPAPSYTCPWNGDKAYFSICFENLQGSPKTNLSLNECCAGSGATRKVGSSHDDILWNDGEFHWFEFEFVNDTQEAVYDGKPVTYTGKTFKFYFDGVMRFEYFQRDQNVYSDYLKDYVKDCKFSTTSGYIGFWPSSDFPVGMDSSETECYVEIDKLQITSYDNGNKTPYGIAPKPDFDIESVNFTPEASYDAGTEIEVKLADLFAYEGDDALSYAIKCEGKDIGSVRNGYWVWTPEKGGNYDVDFIASNADGKSATTYVTFRVAGDATPEPEPSESGCKSAVSASAGIAGGALILAGAALALIGRKRER